MTCCGGCADKSKKVARRVQAARIAPAVTQRCCSDPVTRAEFIATARTWEGVRWLHQGRNRYGVDCIGLLLVTCWSLGLTDYDVTGYGRTPNADFMRQECDRLMVRTDDPQPGDVFLMAYEKAPQHIAIFTGPKILHAYAGARRVVETTMPKEWRQMVVASYVVPGVV